MTSYSEYGGYVKQLSTAIAADTPLSVDVVQLGINNANHLVDEAGQHLVNVAYPEEYDGDKTLWTQCESAFDFCGAFIFPIHVVPRTALPYGIVVHAEGRAESIGAVFRTCLNTIDREPSADSAIEMARSIASWQETIAAYGTIVDSVVVTFPTGFFTTLLSSVIECPIYDPVQGTNRILKVPALRLGFYAMSADAEIKVSPIKVHVREFRR